MNLVDSQDSAVEHVSFSLSERSSLLAKETSKDQARHDKSSSNKYQGQWTLRKAIILSLLAFVYFLTWCCVSLWASFFPVEAKNRGVSSTEVGLIYGTYSLVAFAASFLYGPCIIPKIGPYFVLFAGLFLNAGTNIICGFISAIHEHRLFSIYCFIVRSVGALGGAACETAIVVVATEEFRENIATAISLLRLTTGLGFVIGPVLGGGLYSLGGFSLPLFVTGGSLLVALPLVWYFLPRQESHHIERSMSRRPSLKKALMIPGVVFTSFWYLVGIISISFVEPTLQPFAAKFGINTVSVGLLFLGICGTYILGAPFIGKVLDTKPWLRRPFIVFGAFGIFICCLLFGPTPLLSSFIPRKLWLLVFSLTVSGLFFAFGLVPILPELLHCCYDRGFPKNIATDSLMSGIYTGFANLGAFIGPALGGILTDAVGFPWTSTIMGFTVAGAALILVVFYVCSRHQTGYQNADPEKERLFLIQTQSYENVHVCYRQSMSFST